MKVWLKFILTLHFILFLNLIFTKSQSYPVSEQLDVTSFETRSFKKEYLIYNDTNFVADKLKNI